MLFRRHVSGDERIVAHDANGVSRGFGFDADFVQFAEERVEVSRIASRDVEIASGHGAGNNEGSSFDAVGNDAMFGALQLAYAFNPDGPRSGAFDLRSHLVQKSGEVS